MGYLYRPKYKAADGSLRESAVWWVQYRHAGRTKRESTGTRTYEEARRCMKRREGAVARGEAIAPRADRITFREMAELVRRDYRLNGKDLETLEVRLKHLEPAFGDWT